MSSLIDKPFVIVPNLNSNKKVVNPIKITKNNLFKVLILKYDLMFIIK